MISNYMKIHTKNKISRNFTDSKLNYLHIPKTDIMQQRIGEVKQNNHRSCQKIKYLRCMSFKLE